MRHKGNGTTDGRTAARSATTGKYVDTLVKKYARYSRSPEEVRREVDNAMGDAKLTDALYRERGKH